MSRPSEQAANSSVPRRGFRSPGLSLGWEFPVLPHYLLWEALCDSL